jgi:molybdopterin-guanine dinucleotide biosynthesis protein A
MPWLNRDLLEYMISIRETADIIVPRWEKYPEPLHAVYSHNCLAPITANLEADILKITAFFGKVSTHFLDQKTIAQFDPTGQSFNNVNTPQELEQIQLKSAETEDLNR